MTGLDHVLAAHPSLARLARSALGQPETWALIAFKGALVKRLGPQVAHQTLTELLAASGPVRPEVWPLVGLDELTRGSPHRWTFAEPGPLDLPGVCLVGGGRSPPCRVLGRALFCARLDDVVTIGRSNVRLIGERACLDLQADERERYRTDWWFDPAIVTVDGGAVLGHRPVDIALHLDECIDLTGVFSPGWGHCVLEFAPQLLLAEWCSAVPREVPLLVDAGLPASHYDMLEHLCGRRRPIVRLGFRQAAQVRRLWAASAPEFWPALRSPGQRFRPEHSSMNPGSLAKLLATAPSLPLAAEGFRKLFLTRTGAAVRLANQDEVGRWLALEGYTTVCPERLSFAEQLQLVTGATDVAGAAGSQCLLAIAFGNPDLRMALFHAPELEETPTWSALSEARGQQMVILPGETSEPNGLQPYNDLYTVNLADWGRVAEAWI